jgi:hypothetical protein
VCKAVPTELETILLKAVAKSPADRYATAREFADDLNRFLRYEPILARRPTLVQRARKWFRRHPAVPVAGLVLLALLSVGSFVSAWLIRAEQGKTQVAYDRERQRSEEAEQRFQLARRSVDQMIQLTEEELQDHPHLHPLRKRMLEAALVYYQEFMKLRRDDPKAQGELAVTRDRVKHILGDLAALQGAGQHFLLEQPGVLDDLRASPEQRERVAEELRRQDKVRQESFHEFIRLPPDERRRLFLEHARTNEKEIALILGKGQLARLRQLALQAKGTAAFREPDVTSALKLTLEQRDRIRAIEEELFFRKGDGRRPGLPAEPQRKDDESAQRALEREQARRAAARKALEGVLALLTREQAKRWRDLVGEPFVGELEYRPFGRPVARGKR